MADNYLEKKFEEYRSNKGAAPKHKAAAAPSLDSLLLKNRSYRGYDPSYVVSKEELLKMVEVVTKVPSGKNGQVLRYKLVLPDDAPRLQQYTKWAGALPLKAANGEDIALSLSIGAAMFNGHPDYERLIQIADEALYIAKRRGRNRVELWKASL